MGNGEAIRRRDFVAAVLGAAAAAWPLTARTQQSERTRHIGALINLSAEDPEIPARVGVFVARLAELGWSEGRNLRIDYRWGAGDPTLYRRYAAELVALAPDILLATSGPIVAALQRESRSVPIVFANIIDPGALGYVESVARPGGNATGFSNVAHGFSAKWLEVLKQMAPNVTRVAVLRDPTVNAGTIQFDAIQSASSSFGVAVSPIDLRDIAERERAVAEFARRPNGGMIVTASTFARLNRRSIIAQASQHGLPTVYPSRFYAVEGGLISYGPVVSDQYRRAAEYVDRILKGAKPADLPVQSPVRYETIINLKTVRDLGITVPRLLLAGTDEFIE